MLLLRNLFILGVTELHVFSTQIECFIYDTVLKVKKILAVVSIYLEDLEYINMVNV